MLAVALALVSAVGFGASDYAAGLATRAAGVLQGWPASPSRAPRSR
jgi:hypothetical protein